MPSTEQKLKSMNLKFGSVHLIKYKNEIYGTADFTHCPKKDLIHNIQVLLNKMDNENLDLISKDYDSEIYKTKHGTSRSGNFGGFVGFLQYDVINHKDSKLANKLFVLKNNGEPTFLSFEYAEKLSRQVLEDN